MKNISLRYKLFLVFATLILLYAVCSVVFVNIYLKNTLRKHFIETGKTFANTISSYITNDILVKDFVSIEYMFEDTMRQNPYVSYIFVEKNGMVFIHTFEDEFPKGLIDIGHKKNEPDYVLVDGGQDIYYDFSSPILGGREGILRLGMSGKAISEMTGKITRALLYVALAAVISAIAFAILISRRLSRPITALTSSAVKIAAGDYIKTGEVHGDDEVGRLSKAFNIMADAVRLREKELREINEEMEAVNIRLHEHIEELNRTKEELVKSRQDAAVVQTSKAMIHHMRQPLTYLTMAIEMFTDEIREGNLNMDSAQKKLFAIEEAAVKVSELLGKFETLKEYRTVAYSDDTKIVDIGE